MSYEIRFGKIVRKGKTDARVGLAARPTVSSVRDDRNKFNRKGKFAENCNVTACQKPGAYYYNIGSDAYYCHSCAHNINSDGCRRYGEPDLCYEAQRGQEGQTFEQYAESLSIQWTDEVFKVWGFEKQVGIVLDESHSWYKRGVCRRHDVVELICISRVVDEAKAAAAVAMRDAAFPQPVAV